MLAPRRSRARRTELVLAAGALVLAVAATGPAAAAATGLPARPGSVACARAQAQWARITKLNQRAKTAFARAQALANQLLRRGRANLAHRLDARFAYLRQVHQTLVDRVATIAARIAGRCSAAPPQLLGY